MRSIFGKCGPIAVAWIVVFQACGAPGQSDTADSADRVFTNAKVYTVDSQQPWAEAVAISGNEIVYVGEIAGALELVGENTVQHDLEGKMLLPRFAELDVIAQSTPLWASYDDYGKQYVSEDQFKRYWRFKSLEDLGVRLTWGSDFPATGAGMLGMSPVLQMEIGHTRQYAGEPDSPVQPRESERLDLESLVRGYTIDAAYQLHMEDKIGSLEVGKKADLVILDRNLFEIDPYEIHQAQVIMTVMDGEVVYERE